MIFSPGYEHIHHRLKRHVWLFGSWLSLQLILSLKLSSLPLLLRKCKWIYGPVWIVRAPCCLVTLGEIRVLSLSWVIGVGVGIIPSVVTSSIIIPNIIY